MEEKVEKTKKIVRIVLGFVLSAYLIYTGLEMLEEDATKKENIK